MAHSQTEQSPSLPHSRLPESLRREKWNHVVCFRNHPPPFFTYGWDQRGSRSLDHTLGSPPPPPPPDSTAGAASESKGGREEEEVPEVIEEVLEELLAGLRDKVAVGWGGLGGWGARGLGGMAHPPL